MKTAILSECGTYRYRLTRGKHNLMPVVMLNPSTADASVDDATIRRLLGFAGRGLKLDTETKCPVIRYDGIDVVNLYAYRSTDPKVLREVADPYGPDNRDTHYKFIEQYAGEIIVAWGSNATEEAEARFFEAYDKIVGVSTLVSCFGITKNGSPKHPLYLANGTPLCPYFRRW